MSDDSAGNPSPSNPASAQRRPVRPKYQVFISSTFTDLQDARSKVTWEVLKAGHIPVGMENFSAADERGWRTIQRTIDTSDYYVLIVGGRYGSIDNSIGMSWTEREYRYAKEKSVPVLAFVRDDSYITKDKVDRGDAAERLNEFVKTIKGLHLCEKWTTEEDLCSRAVQAIRKAIDDAELDGMPRPGWYRGDQLPSLAAIDEIAVLSLENRKLRAQAEALARPDRAVLNVLDAKGNELRDIEIEQPLYVLYVPEGGSAIELALGGRMGRVDERSKVLADKISRMYWLGLELRNSGSKVARAVIVDVDVEGAKNIVLFREKSPAYLLLPEPEEITDPAEHVYVDSRRRREGGVLVRQRIRQVAVGASEALVVMGLLGSFDSDGRLKFTVKYRAVSEDGESVDGLFAISVSPIENRVTVEQFKKKFR